MDHFCFHQIINLIKDTINCPQNKSFYPNHAYSCLGFGKLSNVFQSPIGRMASQTMRNIEKFPSKQMYLYLSLVERKVAEFYHNIDRRRYLVWLKLLIFITFFQAIAGVLVRRAGLSTWALLVSLPRWSPVSHTFACTCSCPSLPSRPSKDSFEEWSFFFF